MKNKTKMNTEPQAEINMLLYAVAPTPKLSTDSNALVCVSESSGIAIGATSEDVRINVFSKGKLIGQDYKSTSGNWMHKWILPNGKFERGSWRGKCHGEGYTYQIIND